MRKKLVYVPVPLLTLKELQQQLDMTVGRPWSGLGTVMKGDPNSLLYLYMQQ